MSCQPAFSPVLLAALGLIMAAAAARGQTVPAECKALLDAQKKEITTPHHVYSTEGPAGASTNTHTGEIISTGGVIYLLYEGQWTRSPMTPQMQLDQMQENIANDVKTFSCRREGEESVGGIAAVVYSSHNESDAGKADTRLWIAKGSGLPLRTEQDLDTGFGGKRHISIRYEYANVRAPAGVK